VAEVFFPDEIAVEVVAVDAVRPEGGVEELTVGRGGAGGVGVGVVHPFMRSGFAGGLFPDDFAGVAIEAEDVEFVDVARTAVATTETAESASAAGAAWSAATEAALASFT